MFQKQEPLTPCRHILRNMKEIYLLPNWWFIFIIPIYMVKNVELPTTLSSKFLFQKPTIARTVKNLAARGLKKKDTASQRILMNGWPWEIIALYHATSAVSIIVFFLGGLLFAWGGNYLLLTGMFLDHTGRWIQYGFGSATYFQYMLCFLLSK